MKTRMSIKSNIINLHNRKNSAAIFIIVLASVAALFLTEKTAAQTYSTDTLSIASGITRNGTLDSSNNDNQCDSKLHALNVFQKNNLSSDWWGIRNNLNDAGLTFDFIYKAEVIANIKNGLNRGSKALDNIDLMLSADLAKTIGWENTNIFLYVLGNSGGVPNDLCGTLQGISNIETVPAWKLYQLLIEKTFFDGRFSVKTGLYDLNSEFDTKETSGIFINPSHGIGPDFSQSGLNGPSIFPTTSMAVRFKYEFENGNYLQTAILDGVPGNPDNPFGTFVLFNKNDGLLLATELGLVDNIDEQLLGKIAVGAWIYTSSSEKYNFVDNNFNYFSYENNFGFYLNAEKLLSNNQTASGSNLYGFMRIGYANENVNPVDFYFGAGLKFTGLLSGREEDEFGVAFALAHNSTSFRKAAVIFDEVSVRPFELNFEATYMLYLTPWLIIQPDIQYIINPSYCTQFNNAFTVGSRMHIVF